MPRRQAENERIRDEQRQNILRAAEKVFARKGLAAAKMTEIAAAAGVSYGLAYHYFESKEELFAALVEHEIRGTMRGIQEALEERHGTPWERLTRMVAWMLQGMQEQPEAVLVTLHALTSEATPPEIRQRFYELAHLNNEVITQLIIEGQKAGEVVQGDPEQLAAFLGSSIQGIAISMTYGGVLSLKIPDAALVLRGLKA